MALIECLGCDEVWVNVEYPNDGGSVKRARCWFVIGVKLEGDQLESCEVGRSGQGGSFLYGTP